MTKPISFIDVFAGCGGLSLGLVKAGCKGLFAVEKSPSAFETLERNLIREKSDFFSWPSWLPKTAQTCEDLLRDYSDKISGLNGGVDLIVGGPPCQGFSTAGKRDPVDPRNKMSEQYLALVGLVMPKFIVIENVAGFDIGFEGTEGALLKTADGKKQSYAKYIDHRLTEMGYSVSTGLLNCAEFGVPQTRRRFFMFCEKKENKQEFRNLFSEFVKTRKAFLESKKLPIDRYVTSKEALSDLETLNKKRISSNDSNVKNFLEAEYVIPETLNAYQQAMRNECKSTIPNSRRLAKHKENTIAHFKNIQQICRPGISISQNEMKQVGTKKHSITVLNTATPAPTVTTLPDDILHYSEPRILTVRENARLQSFPDWYEFFGSYTTGGKRRKFECPRYTQVGNAVPPLVSEAIGLFLQKLVSEEINIEENIIENVDF
jgi:DNA (cytosine-5)-methyltransferase 1